MTRGGPSRIDDGETEPSVANVYRTEYGVLEERTASEAVVETVADALDVDQYEVGPLQDVVDADSLNGLFLSTNARRTDCRVAFEFEGCEVFVREREVLVAPPDADDG